MSLANLSPRERSEEISSFAAGFLTAVTRGTVYSDDYALTSEKRGNYHIPTGTAPITLEGAMEILQHTLDKQEKSPSPEIISNLESAVEKITMAKHFLKGGHARLSPSEQEHIDGYIDSALPRMKTLISDMKMRQGL